LDRFPSTSFSRRRKAVRLFLPLGVLRHRALGHAAEFVANVGCPTIAPEYAFMIAAVTGCERQRGVGRRKSTAAVVPKRKEPALEVRSAELRHHGFLYGGLGVADFGGYFSVSTRLCGESSASHQPRRSHAQAPSGDVQSSASLAPHCERSEWGCSELPVLLRFNRTVTRTLSAAASLPRHAAVHVLRTHRALYRWGGLKVNRHPFMVMNSSLPRLCLGGDSVVGPRPLWVVRPAFRHPLVSSPSSAQRGARSTVSP
jgi:hypothetical protein